MAWPPAWFYIVFLLCYCCCCHSTFFIYLLHFHPNLQLLNEQDGTLLIHSILDLLYESNVRCEREGGGTLWKSMIFALHSPKPSWCDQTLQSNPCSDYFLLSGVRPWRNQQGDRRPHGCLGVFAGCQLHFEWVGHISCWVVKLPPESVGCSYSDYGGESAFCFK